MSNNVPRKAIKVQFKDSNKSAIKITFPFNYNDLANVKTLSGRRFHKQPTPFWTCPLNIEAVESLQEWGFELDQELIDWKESYNNKIITPKIELDFSLCPLYNGFWKSNSNKEKNYAERSLSQNQKSIGSSKEEPSKRQGSRSPKEGDGNTQRNRSRPSVEGESLPKHKESNARSQNQTETSGRIETSSAKTRSELSRGEWTGINQDCRVSRSAIISMWFHKGISNPDKNCEEYFQKCRECIQSRLCESGTENSNRIRRTNTSEQRSTREGQKENANSGTPWMDCHTLTALHSMKIIPGLQKGLRKFQLQDLLKTEQLNGRILNGSEMGLGKTVTTLAYLQLHSEKRPVVIVCPASLKLNWLKEIHEWMETPDVQVLGGKNPNMPIVGDILIINYDILDSWVNKLKQINPQIIITDECHYYKNNQAKRTKAVKKLCKNIPHIIALSGTPIVNRPIEGFNALKIIDDAMIPNFWKFAQRYCGAKHNGFGWDFSGATNTDELHEKLVNTVMIRRKKEDVLPDLPPKVYSTIPFEINNQKEYKRAENDFIQYITETKGEKAAKKANNAEVLTRINGLKQISVRGKLKQAKDWIKNFIESNGKLVVFAVHKETINGLMEEFGEQAIKIDGSVSGQKREEAVEQFQNNDSIRLFVGNIQAAGVGLNLTAASSVAFLELPWTPGDLQQASDRVHRIGQNKSVNIYYLLASGTIEEEIAELIDKKRRVLDSVLDGEETNQESLLTELISSYKD